MKRSPPSSSLLSLPPLLSSQRGSGGRKSSAGEMNKWLKYCQLVRLFFSSFPCFSFFCSGSTPVQYKTRRERWERAKNPTKNKKRKSVHAHTAGTRFFFKSPTKINQKKKAERGFFFLKEKENQEDFGGTSCSHFTKCNKIFPAKFYKSVAIQEKQTNKQTYISYLQRHEEEPLCYV